MIRQHGVVASASGLIPFGHLGWGYRDRSEFLARAAEYIVDGLAQNQWVEYVGGGSRAELRAELDTLRAIADGSDVKVTPALEFYGVPEGSDIVDPALAVTTRVAAVESAIEQGYNGFRAIVDATALTQRPEQREAFARFEYLIDQKMAVLPVSALCAYDTSRLGGDAAGLVCLHPLVNDRAPTFRIFADTDAAFALDGEIDAAGADTFTAVIQRIWPLACDSPADRELVINAAALDFISHPELLALDRRARRDDRHVVLRGCGPLLTRLGGLLDLTNLRLEPALN